jgi:catechol 2,3-dioxygenase-like lactoylglutathione lyase family enzyme
MRLLNLMVLRCTDIERSRQFYERLGMRFVQHARGKGPQHYACEDEHGVFELYPATHELNGDMTGLGFDSAGVDALRAELLAAGFEPGPIQQQPWGRVFVVRDPDGRRVEMKQV